MNSSSRIAAGRYAAAYDRLSSTAQEAARRAEELAAAAKALTQVNTWLNAPEISLAHKKETVQAALKRWPQVGSFIEVLLDSKRYNLLAQIVQDVQALSDKRRHLLRAEVYSARPLSADEKTHTQEALSARYGQTVSAVFKTDKNLLGGLKIWCNGELVDGSLQRQLDRLQEELTK